MSVSETQLDSFGPAVRVKRVPLSFYGLQMGTRMTVVTLSDAAGGGLWVHSPTALTPALKQEIDALDQPVRYLIAPNRLHHLFIGDWAAQWPQAEVWGVRQLMKKRPDIRWSGPLTDPHRPPAAETVGAVAAGAGLDASGWAADIDQVIFSTSFQDEAIFLHRASRTLILVDLFESVWPEDHWFYRIVSRIAGTWRRPTLTRDQRLTVRDKAAARATCETILTWDFDRIILAHGRLIPKEGKQAFRDGMAWLMGRTG